jgi:hypothetical protein
VPTVAVLIAYASYGALFVTVFGFVSPENSARTSSPHVSADPMIRRAFVDTAPVVVHASWISQLAVRVQSVVWSSGPFKVKVPTSKLYFVTSPPGEWLQHSVNALPGVPSVAVPKLYTS